MRNLIIPTLAGVVAGVVSAVVLATPSAQVPRPSAAPTSTAALPTASPSAHVERRLARLEARPLAVSAAPRSEDEEPLPPVEDPDAMRAQLQERLDDQLSTHANEPRDPDFANEAELLVTEDLHELADSAEYSLIDVDCRTQACTAWVEWPSYEQARAEYGRLLHHDYQQNCARSITVLPPGDPAAIYRAALIFDCTDQGL